MPIEQLRDKLLNNFVRYGIVKELIIYLDDWAQRWFSGNECIYLERPPSSGIKFDPLTYISWWWPFLLGYVAQNGQTLHLL